MKESIFINKNNGYYSRNNNRNIVEMRKFTAGGGFTLAEVLITLGIIGVVAALTIPTLISNYQEKQTLSQLQKTYATLKNAFELAKVEHGDYNTWSWNQIPQTNSNRVKYFWETYIFPNLKVSKQCFPASEECLTEVIRSDSQTVQVGDLDGAFVLGDGTTILTWTGADSYFPHVWIYADINGKKSPNTLGKDIFVMYFSPNNPGNQFGSTDDEGNFHPEKNIQFGYGLNFYGDYNGLTIDDLMDSNLVLQSETGVNTNIGCSNKSAGLTCGAAIKMNGWKFPDNYLQ